MNQSKLWSIIFVYLLLFMFLTLQSTVGRIIIYLYRAKVGTQLFQLLPVNLTSASIV